MKDFRDKLIKNQNTRINNRIEAGHFLLSIQNNDFHYCSPRISDLPIKEYEQMEMAIFTNDDVMDWVIPSKNKKIKSFPKFKKLNSYFEQDCKCPVGGYIPVDLINEFYNYLLNLNKQ